MVDLLKICFKKEFESEGWQHKLREMIPSLGKSFVENADLSKSSRERTGKTLQLIE